MKRQVAPMMKDSKIEAKKTAERAEQAQASSANGLRGSAIHGIEEG